MVPTERLELSRPKSQPPQGCVSTNSTTTAFITAIILSVVLSLILIRLYFYVNYLGISSVPAGAFGVAALAGATFALLTILAAFALTTLPLTLWLDI